MANELTDLKNLIITMPGYVDATNPTDSAVDSWLDELTPGPFVDVSFEAFEAWVAEFNLFGELHNSAETNPSNDDSSGSRMLDLVLMRGVSLQTSNADVRAVVAVATQPPGSRTIPATAGAALDALMQPMVQRWTTADWTINPGLGDIEQARALP